MQSIIFKVILKPQIIKYHSYLAMLFVILSIISFFNSLTLGFVLFITGLTINFIGLILQLMYTFNTKKNVPSRSHDPYEE